MRAEKKRAAVAAMAMAAIALLAGQARAASPGAPVWQSPTPAEGAALTVRAGSALTLSLAASLPDPTASIQITDTGLPAAAKLVQTAGNPATATLKWTPSAGAVGDYVLVLIARAPNASVAIRSLVVRVSAPARSAPAESASSFVLSGVGNVWRWAPVVRPADVRVAPALSARRLAVLPTTTPEGTSNLVLLLDGRTIGGRVWIHVRFPVLPNDESGWVQSDSLGAFQSVRTRLVVDRATYSATLYRAGVPIFRTRVGVGKAATPTPAGEFYIREKLTSFASPAYGPLAFGTSARSATLTDWPGGGFVGIHGTNEPQILPGAVSHGCIRLTNAAILRLAQLMPVGTPLTIR